MSKPFDLKNLITGRVEPRIYAFTTNTIPNYLKVGDTYRPVEVRLNEWREHYKNLKKQFEGTAKINDEVFFRDYSVHQFLENDLQKERLSSNEIDDGVYYSNEFFKETSSKDVQTAIKDIQNDFFANGGKYQLYKVRDSLPVEHKYESTGFWSLRPNQDKTVKAFVKAVNEGRTNLLMYAVMRFGKSFTSMCCATTMNKGKGAKFVVIVSAKADVKDEWRKTIQSAENFRNDYEFLSSDDLSKNYSIVSKTLKEKKVALFLTLQDLQGDEIKRKHKQIFSEKVDLLIIDETHFGARAESYGAILNKKTSKRIEDKDDDSVYFDETNVEEVKKELNAKVTLHLSGTPYRILMGSEFEKEDIIAFYQFTDIVDEQKAWDKKYCLEDGTKGKSRNEWDNPYYGFPEMIRFAFNPNESSLKRMDALKAEGKTCSISALFEPLDDKKGVDAGFVHEKEVLDLLEIIDGSKKDSNVLGFLDYPKLKEGKMCRHVVMVLPRCASCDAMENLLRKYTNRFHNLNRYEIINISGVNGRRKYKEPKDVKRKIRELENNECTTITLTVNRMLTGSTVEQWDTMIYLKDSSSAQEYDQAIFRLQNQFIKVYQDKDGNEIKYNMKPQTLLVDFDPQRMFRMQELKSQIYNANVDKSGNDKLEGRIAKELDYSPIVYFNRDKIERVEASDILSAVSEYSQNRGVAEETNDVPVDLDLMTNKTIWDAISKENELGSKNGFTIKPTEGDGDDIDDPDDSEDNGKEDENGAPPDAGTKESDEDDAFKKVVKKFRMYYARILFYAFLTRTEVHSLNQVIESFNDEENSRICRNLGLSKVVLKELCRRMNCFMLSKLDYKIQNLNKLSRDDSVEPLQRAEIAISKFGRISDSEIVTPAKIANQMVAELPSKVFEVGEKPILDIAAKEGEFAAALCNRFEKLKVEKKAYKNQIYSIVTSKVAYEFTRKVYEILGLNTDNISEHFTSYDLLDVKTVDGKNIDYSHVKKLLSQNKKFNKITLEDSVSKKDVEMKFSAVVGNPPYHKENAENGRKPPIYNHFMDLSYVFAPVSVLITPARFLFGAGQTPSEWNERILNDIHFKIGMYEPDSAKVFPNAIKDIKGGLLISIHDVNSSFDSVGVFSPYNELNSILRKVRGEAGFIPLENIVSSQGVFKFTKKCLVEHPEIEKVAGKGTKEKIVSKVVELLPKVFTEQSQNASSILLLAKGKNARIMRYIARKNIQENNYIDTYNVLVPESNGKGAFDEFSSPVISKPGEGFSDTFISIGTFITKNEAENALKYIMTKFARTMLGIKKATQHNPKSTWAYVPLLDFSSKSDIVWSKSVTKIDEAARKKYKLDINEIDAQLYAKYNLSKEEITFIETHVKEMK
jgi:hypothetical protein